MEIFHALEDEVCNGVEDEQHVLVLKVTYKMSVCRRVWGGKVAAAAKN
jgi:hypothetical protein